MVDDDDPSAIKVLLEQCSSLIEKNSDINYVKKNVGNKLYDLKADGHSELSTKVLKYVQKCFFYALTQNKGDADGLRAALTSIVPHMYGDHTDCGSWCGYAASPSTYKHSGLPYGRDLTCQATKSALLNLFEAYSQNAEKLATHGSSQANESFNTTVCSKQPKSRSYASSASFNYRVAAAVCRKNIGHTCFECA